MATDWEALRGRQVERQRKTDRLTGKSKWRQASRLYYIDIQTDRDTGREVGRQVGNEHMDILHRQTEADIQATGHADRQIDGQIGEQKSRSCTFVGEL